MKNFNDHEYIHWLRYIYIHIDIILNIMHHHQKKLNDVADPFLEHYVNNQQIDQISNNL